MNKVSAQFYLFAACAFLAGCTTHSETGRKKVLGIVPVPRWLTGGRTDTLTDGPPDHSWMFQATAIAVVLFALGAVWLSGGKPTKSTKLFIVTGMGFSVWGAGLPTIQASLATFLPWIVGGFLLWGVVDIAMGVYTRTTGKAPQLLKRRKTDS